MDRLAEIQARLDAATPGPWERADEDVGVVSSIGEYVFIARNIRPGNVTFIAHAPDDVAYLLARVRELESRCYGCDSTITRCLASCFINTIKCCPGCSHSLVVRSDD